MDFYIHESILKPETSLLSFYVAVECEMGRFTPHRVIDKYSKNKFYCGGNTVSVQKVNF